MATRGTKTTLIAAACAVAVLAGAVAVYWNDLVVEWQIRRLTSSDRQERSDAARAVSRMGIRVVPRLLEAMRAELEKHDPAAGPLRPGSDPSVPDAEIFVFARAGSEIPVEQPAVASIGRALATMGAPAIPSVIRQMDDRSHAFVTALVHVLSSYRPSGPLRSHSIRVQGGKHLIAIDPSPLLAMLRDDPAEPADIRAAAAEMLEKLRAKQAAAKVE